MDQTGLLTTGNDYCNDSLFNFLLSISENFLVTNQRAVVEQLMKSQVYYVCLKRAEAKCIVILAWQMRKLGWDRIGDGVLKIPMWVAFFDPRLWPSRLSLTPAPSELHSSLETCDWSLRKQWTHTALMSNVRVKQATQQIFTGAASACCERSQPTTRRG